MWSASRPYVCHSRRIHLLALRPYGLTVSCDKAFHRTETEYTAGCFIETSPKLEAMSKRRCCSWSCERITWIFLIVCASTLTVHANAFYPHSKVRHTQGFSKSPLEDHSLCINGIARPKTALKTTSLKASPSALVGASTALLLRGGEVSELATAAYDWCINLGNPSALVAGAVVATLYENMGSGDLDIQKKDSKAVRFGKRLTRVLLLTAFAFEILSIFVTTVTGTMLLSKPEHVLDEMVEVTKDTTPLSFLRDNFEFEYLTARITFLQGLLNWLMAIALNHIIPHGESKETRVMNKYIGSSLCLSKCRCVLVLQTIVPPPHAWMNYHQSHYSHAIVLQQPHEFLPELLCHGDALVECNLE